MKCSGKIGYARTEETSPGIYQEIITEKQYYGDVVRNTTQIVDSNTINANIKLNNSISVLCNNYMSENLWHSKSQNGKLAVWKLKIIE